MFIRKIFQDKVDEGIHRHFVRFGKGTYGMKAVMNVRKQKEKVKISTTFEYAIDFIEFILSFVDSVKVSGFVWSRQEIQGLEGKKKKGLFNYEIDKEIKKEELNKILSDCYFALLDCSVPGMELKVKKKLPKPGKGSKKNIGDKFCVLSIENKLWAEFHKEFLFDLPENFKKARIEHTYVIKEIVISPELKKQGDFEKIRQGAKRKGQIIRKIIVDEKESENKKDFAV